MEFPNILVINLDSRPERLEEIHKNFQGWPRLERVSAIKDSPGWKGCSKSHVKCVKIAKERGYPWVLILEDDCEVKPDSLSRFRELLPPLWDKKSDWDIFLGGCTSVDVIKQVNTVPPIFHVTGLTTHFCLYYESAYDKLIEEYTPENEDKIIVIDLFVKKALRTFCTTPFLAVQKPGKSDLENVDVDYTVHFSNGEARLNQYLESQIEGFASNYTIFNSKKLAINFIITSVFLVTLLVCTNHMYHKRSGKSVIRLRG